MHDAVLFTLREVLQVQVQVLVPASIPGGVFHCPTLGHTPGRCMADRFTFLLCVSAQVRAHTERALARSVTSVKGLLCWERLVLHLRNCVRFLVVPVCRSRRVKKTVFAKKVKFP